MHSRGVIAGSETRKSDTPCARTESDDGMVAGTRDDRPGEGRTGAAAAVHWGGLVLLCILWSVPGHSATAQPGVQIETRASADSVLIGGRFTVSFAVEHDGDVTVPFPDPATGPDQFGDVEIRRRRTVGRRSIGGGRQVDSAAYEVTTFALDSARVAPVPLPIVTNGDTSIASTPPRGVKVVSVLKANRKGIHSVAPLAAFPRPIWPWLLAALAGTIVLGALAYYAWWHRHQPDEAPSVGTEPLSEVNQTPYEAATSWIRQLESYDLSDPDAVKPFYVELSNAVRVYVANELGVRALERTTREVINALDDRPDVPDDAVEQLRTVLEQADLVKFAGLQPSLETHEQVLREARSALDAIEATPRGTRAEIDEVVNASEASD